MGMSRADGTEVFAFELSKPSYVELVFSLVLVWGFGDTLSTVFAAKHVGVAAEQNPWIRELLAFEPLLVILVKMAVALYVGIVLLECRDIVETVPWWRGWLLTIVALGAVVVLNNTYVGLAAVAA